MKITRNRTRLAYLMAGITTGTLILVGIFGIIEYSSAVVDFIQTQQYGWHTVIILFIGASIWSQLYIRAEKKARSG